MTGAAGSRDSGDQESSGQEASGQEASGQEASGREVLGQEVLGQEVLDQAIDGPDEWRPHASLSNALPVMLLRARESVMQLYRPLFRSAGLTERQWRVLRALYDGGRLEPSELARRAYMHPPNVSRVINEMRDAGYLDRLVVDADQRRAQVVLTPAGRGLCARVGTALDARTAQLRAAVDRTSLLALTGLLEEIIALPERHPGLTDPDNLSPPGDPADRVGRAGGGPDQK